jgi:integrase
MMGNAAMTGQESEEAMPKRAAGLTARQVETRRLPGLFADGGGLYLQVTASGARSWIFRYQLAGRRRDMGLGSAERFGVTLAEARERARAARRLVEEQIDPIDARRAERNAAVLERVRAITFKECAARYIAAHRQGWKNPVHATQWPSTLESYVYPVFGEVALPAIDVGLVMQAIEPIWNRKPETASRVRGRIENILDYAAARGWRSGENPARWRGHLDKLLPKKTKVRQVQHHAALPHAELGAFMAELRQQNGIAARALDFAILTAARTSEVIGARWSEVNLAERLWTVPAERMKPGREHRVPLSQPALAVLRDMAAIRLGDFVFPGNSAAGKLSNMAMLALLRRMGRGDLTAHGFRSTFSDWAAERTGFPAEVREMALAHAVGDKVEAAYRRGDLFQKRRQIMDAWAKFCGAPARRGQVVPFLAAASAG